MKKFTLTMMAALMAVVTWAKGFEPSMLAGSDPLTLIVKSYAYTEKNYGTDEEPDLELEAATLKRIAESWTFTLTDAATGQMSITGIMGGYETVTATIAPVPEASASGYTITIPCGQKAAVTEYGDVYLFNYSGKESLTATITDEGIVFDDKWYTAFIDGDYAGLVYKDIYQSTAVLPNGKMAIENYNPREGGYWTQEYDVAIDFDPVKCVATVWNFMDFHVAIDVQLKNGGKFVIEPQIVETDMMNIEPYYTTGINYKDVPVKITGTGTENTLTMSGQWTCFAPKTGYSWDTYNPATITYDGTFTYPVIEEVATTPADPEVVFFTHWTEETGNATVTLNIFPYDIDDNELITRLLSYQLYTKDASGRDLALGDPIDYDNTEFGDSEKKKVSLGEEAKGLTVVGVKSIYTAKGETNESDIVWFDIPQLTAVPDGLDMKEYPTTAEVHDDNYYNYTSERVSKVAIDGTDIYIQGILPQCPYAWAKGTITTVPGESASGFTVTIPSMQCQGSSDDMYVYLAGLDFEAMRFKDIVFQYNADEDIYVSSDMIIGNAGTGELAVVPPYLNGMTIGTEKIPEAVQLPEGAEVKDYPFVGETVDDGYILEFESNVKVAVVGDDVYVQGLNPYVPEAWVKGTVATVSGASASASTIVFPTGQNFGVDETKDLDGNVFFSHQYYFVGANIETGTIEDVRMTYDAEKDYYELQNELLVNDKKSSFDIVKWYMHGSTIGLKEETNLPPLVTATPPEDLNRETWKIEALEMSFNNDEYTPELYQYYCDAGFYTVESAEGTDFYIQGICPERPEIWIKAPLKDGKVIFPASTYLGDTWLSDPETWDYYIAQLFLTSATVNEDKTYTLTDVVFNYDEEKGQLVSTQPIFINANRRELAYVHFYAGMTITRIPDVAATPADPAFAEVGGIDFENTWSQKIHADIKRVDVDGNELLTEKLYYSVWVEKGNEQQPLVFSPSEYWGLDGDVTEIPYQFDNWDITTGGETITLFQSEDEIKSWSRIGLQTIYYGGNERHVSNIVWAENPVYDTTTDIADVTTGSTSPAVCFDLQGRRVDSSMANGQSSIKKGLYIVNGKKVLLK